MQHLPSLLHGVLPALVVERASGTRLAHRNPRKGTCVASGTQEN